MWGITQNTARAHGYRGDMRDLTREQALMILEGDYWYGLVLTRWRNFP
ncbi:Predicted lysozyme (DUF847) [Escherichia coli]|nr:Predicted lysozyme (DUF847) [Escherichia coli]